MVLEATVICLDNSDWMRNGDYTPTRLEAQQDAINLICGAKTQSNPENTVGVLSCAGKSPGVLVTLTSDLGKILSSLHEVKIGGSFDFLASMQVAQLVLKHRQNKNQHQRIIVFVGSPIITDSDQLVRLGKRLKKNNVAVDLVNFGEEAENTEKLEAFVSAVNNDNSHLVTIPPGPHILSDILISSPIIAGDEGGSGVMGSSATSGTSDFGFGGVDPNLEPELALALKVSMEEERARQEEARKKAEGQTENKPSITESTTPSSTTPPKEVEMSEAGDDEEDLLQQAIALSMQHQKKVPEQTTPVVTKNTPPVVTKNTPPPTSTPLPTDVHMQDDDDEEMQRAMQLSLIASDTTPPSSQQTASTSSGDEDINKELMEDPNFVNSILMSLPGVDPDDDRIKSALKQLEQKKKIKMKNRPVQLLNNKLQNKQW